jgi:hypothetical protein
MKTVGLILLFLLLPAFTFGQGDIRFVAQAGLSSHQDLKFSPTWGLASAQLILQFNDFLFLAPECTVWAPELKLKPFFWSPGVTVNYSFGDLFMGGGVCRMIKGADENDVSWAKWQFKAQCGYLGGSVMLTLFSTMETKSLFQDMQLGFLVGVVF